MRAFLPPCAAGRGDREAVGGADRANTTPSVADCALTPPS